MQIVNYFYTKKIFSITTEQYRILFFEKSKINMILKNQENAFDKVSNKQLGVLPGQINSARNAFVEASKK